MKKGIGSSKIVKRMVSRGRKVIKKYGRKHRKLL